jgi:hypothetical protein
MITQTHKLVLNKSCQEDWRSMNITEGGRHCDECNKEVIDFSEYSKEAIIDFFIANSGKSICGRMRKNQMESIQIDRDLLDHNISFWKKFFIIFLIVFGYELFGASFVFAQVLETDTSKYENVVGMEITDSSITDLSIRDSANVYKIEMIDSATFLKVEEEKLNDIATELKKDLDISHSIDYVPLPQIEYIKLSEMLMGFFVTVPENQLEPLLFPKPIISESILVTKYSAIIDINDEFSVKSIVSSSNSKNKKPNKKNQDDTNFNLILLNEISEKKRKKSIS